MRLKCGGLTMINRGGVDSDGFDLSLPHKPVRSPGMQSREMERSYTLRSSQFCSQVLLSRRPVPGKACVDQHDCTGWDSPPFCFPLLEILDSDEVISITGTLGSHVDSNSGSNQTLDRDLIQCLPTFGKMNGGID